MDSIYGNSLYNCISNNPQNKSMNLRLCSKFNKAQEIKTPRNETQKQEQPQRDTTTNTDNKKPNNINPRSLFEEMEKMQVIKKYDDCETTITKPIITLENTKSPYKRTIDDIESVDEEELHKNISSSIEAFKVTNHPTTKNWIFNPRIDGAVKRIKFNLNTIYDLDFSIIPRRCVIKMETVIPDNKPIISAHMCPYNWLLQSDEFACVKTVFFDVNRKLLQINLIDRVIGISSQYSEQIYWEDESAERTNIDPSSLKFDITNVSNCFTMYDKDVQDQLKKLSSLIANEIISKSLRSSVISIKICESKNIDLAKNETGIAFVIAISGLRGFGPSVFYPPSWSPLLPSNIKDDLMLLFDTKTNEFRIAVSKQVLKQFLSLDKNEIIH